MAQPGRSASHPADSPGRTTALNRAVHWKVHVSSIINAESYGLHSSCHGIYKNVLVLFIYKIYIYMYRFFSSLTIWAWCCKRKSKKLCRAKNKRPLMTVAVWAGIIRFRILASLSNRSVSVNNRNYRHVMLLLH